MTSEDLWAVEAAFADIFAAESPPTHSDMDIAFRRAGVLSPREEESRSISKPKRIMNAFSQVVGDADGRVEALIGALANALATKRIFESSDTGTQGMVAELRTQLAKVGWEVGDTGDLSSRGEIDVQTGGREAMEKQIQRLRKSGDDISLMLGAAKDALEAAAKFVLVERHQTCRPDESVEALVRRAMTHAGISTRPADVDNEASKALATLNQAVPKIAEAVRKVRNDQGSGHGRTEMASMSMPEATFIRDLTVSVVNFLLVEHRSRPSDIVKRETSSAHSDESMVTGS
ncbi:abortive infection family protein [Zhihengliuella salsuginis]|uniref:Abortive infection protein-like C-terminal domain-containing protein n=1 Tax=Zhihengliuella salsuginis TaxID=578222 RepID=A0ABQ3GKT4_9MICC|nr:abortive infection family protein [Zhihengliuella salsuginis]GHD13183.1 hypothetical protein GCM10008096_29160 [Zhihengliuella salsuginis]